MAVMRCPANSERADRLGGSLLDARHCWAPRGAVMTRGASPETTPHVVRLFCCQTNDAVVVCTHCIQSAAVRYITATLRTRAARSAAGIRLRQSIVDSSGLSAFSNPQVIALLFQSKEVLVIGDLHLGSPFGSAAGWHRTHLMRQRIGVACDQACSGHDGSGVPGSMSFISGWPCLITVGK